MENVYVQKTSEVRIKTQYCRGISIIGTIKMLSLSLIIPLKYINRFGIGYTDQLNVVTVLHNINRLYMLDLKRTCHDGVITNKSERSNI